MSKQPIRVGVVGAGGNTRARHIPNLQAMDGVEVVSVCNRSRESGQRVARECGIAEVYDEWLALVEADDTDAIVIGTWPYMHCPVTLAALDLGKHVMCEARMAMNAGEARQMLAAATANPDLVAQVVPSPFTLHLDRTIQRLIAAGYIGEPVSVDLRMIGGDFADFESPMHWRQDPDFSGMNNLQLGIMYEALLRWLGPATQVLALGKTVVRMRRDEQGLPRACPLPDHLAVLASMACGAQAQFTFSQVSGLAADNTVTLCGTEGTLRIADGKLEGGRRGDETLGPIELPAGENPGWRVEEEFVAAIRGEGVIERTTFADGVKYMDFTEAVYRSRQTGRAVPVGA